MRVSKESERSQWGDLSAEEIDLLRQRAARYAKAADAPEADVAEVVLFCRGETQFGVRLACLREVRPLRSFCRIPRTSPAVLGILHSRGEILSLHDASAFLDPEKTGPSASWVLVVEYGGERLGLAADEILDIERFSLSRIRPLPITLGERAALCDGLLPGGAVLLSTPRLFDTDAFFCAF